jgi:hypothetical protein
MTLDDLRELAGVADDVDLTSPARLAEVHRRIDRARRRRAASAVAAAVAVVVAVTVGTFALGNLTGRTPDPADSHRPTPSPTRSGSERPVERFHPAEGVLRLTPRQTVLSYNAALVHAVTAFGDPDVRVSLWATVCLACPPPDPSQPDYHRTYRALALTADGYRTTTYLRPVQNNVQSITRIGRDSFLLNDELNAWQRLLTSDGRLRRVRMVDERRAPDDPRLVFECDRNLTDPVKGHDKGESGWCVLDVRSATASPLPATWVIGRSVGRPTLGQRPWGIEYVYPTPLTGYDRAWWLDSGERHLADLPRSSLVGAVASLSSDDTPTYYHWPLWSDRVDIFLVGERSGGLRKVASRPWLPLTRAEMSEAGHPREIGLDVSFARTPDGGLLAWDYRELATSPGLTIWRADSLTRGRFETVYEDGRQVVDGSRLGLDLAVHDGRIYLDTLVSDDDGRTWTEPVTTWRP